LLATLAARLDPSNEIEVARACAFGPIPDRLLVIREEGGCRLCLDKADRGISISELPGGPVWPMALRGAAAEGWLIDLSRCSLADLNQVAPCLAWERLAAA
jgi:hypothetical protein